MRAEADQPDSAERQQAEHGGARHSPALAPSPRCEHEERQHQAGGDLDADADDKRPGGGAKARAGPGRQGERRREHHHDQRVVVRPADRQHEQHRVQPDERGGQATRVAQLPGGARNQRDGGEARRHGDRLERPQAARQPERRRGVAGEREQRSVGGVLVGPADEPEDFVARGLCRHVRVGIKAVQRSQAREAQIAEDVLGDQRRTQQQDHVRGDDRRDERAQRQRAGERQHQQVARAHDQHQRLKATRAEAHAKARQRSRQPTRPSAAAARDVLRRFSGRTGGRQEDRHDDAQQGEQAERARDHGGTARRRATAAAQAPVTAAGSLDRHAGYSRGGRHRSHCYVYWSGRRVMGKLESPMQPRMRVPRDANRCTCVRHVSLPVQGALPSTCDFTAANRHRAGPPGRVAS